MIIAHHIQSISHCISIFLRFLVISDSRFHSYFPAILLISAMLNLCLPLFVPIFLVNNVFLRTWGSESSFSLCKWLFGSIWVAYTIFRHPYIYIFLHICPIFTHFHSSKLGSLMCQDRLGASPLSWPQQQGQDPLAFTRRVSSTTRSWEAPLEWVKTWKWHQEPNGLV